MAVYGDPLEGKHGVLAYAVQSVWGTAVTPNTCAGMTNLDSVENPDPEELQGVGSEVAQFARYRGQKNEATVNIGAVQDITFITQAIRSSGALPILTVAFGLKDDAGTMWSKVYQDCKINSLELEISEEGVLSASVNLWLGKMAASSAIDRPTALSDFPFQWIDGIVTVGGVGKLLKRLSLGIQHNLIRHYPVRASAATADEARLPYRVNEGIQRVSGRLTTYQTLGISRQADVPTSTTLQLALTSRADASNTATAALTGVRMGEERHTGEPESGQEFDSAFIATGISLT